MSKWQIMRKQSIWEQIDKPIFIFCGAEQTEPNYFNKFKENIESNAIYKNVVKLKVIEEPLDTIRILDKAIEFIKANNITKGEVWCVFDKDDFPTQDFNNAINKAAAINKSTDDVKYFVAWSNECFELWFLLHFCYYSSNNGRKDYIDKINDYFIKAKKGKYEKNRQDIFDILLEIGNLKEAIKNANKLLSLHQNKTPADSVPATNVHKLVELLTKYLPNDIKSKFIK